MSGKVLRPFRVHLKSSAGDMYVTMLARDQSEAEMLVGAHQQRRARRFQLAFDRNDAALEAGAITKEQHAAEVVRRTNDMSRYDIVRQVEIGKDENGNPVMGDEVVRAEAPLKIAKITERSA
jgi:hypothetical protein